MKKYKNFLFVSLDSGGGVYSDTSDGYFKSAENNNSVKLPHNNFTVLGIADECINSPYAEEFSAEIVDKDEFGGYFDYELEEYNYDSASDSFQTLARVLYLNPTDYILRDERRK